MRNTFIEELILQARADDSISLIVGDLGYSVVEPFADEFPRQFFNAGIAEQNMAGLAAGMASEGRKVFIYSIANFPTFRAAEQIRNDIDYHNLAVTIVSVGGGLAYGNLGYSHHAVQDYGLMRLFPNMTIASPGDPNEVKACMRYIANQSGPAYLRIGKAGEKNFNKEVPILESFGLNLVKGSLKSEKVIISTGAALPYAINEAEKRSDEISVYTIPIWGMKYSKYLSAELSGFSELTVFEDHLYDGGLGSWILENSVNLDGHLASPVFRRAIDSKILGLVGSQKELNSLGGLGELKE